MTGVNNFITDLLDEFPGRQASTLFINVAAVPVFASGSHNVAVRPAFAPDPSYGLSNQKTPVDRLELIEDMEALGIITDEPCFFGYMTACNRNLVFRVVTVTADGRVMGTRITLIDRVTLELKDALEEANPLGESVFVSKIDMMADS